MYDMDGVERNFHLNTILSIKHNYCVSPNTKLIRYSTMFYLPCIFLFTFDSSGGCYVLKCFKAHFDAKRSREALILVVGVSFGFRYLLSF